jgi:glycosyltransferase involved in cell wall biosynthesis
MVRTYPAYESRIHTVYLGTRDAGPGQFRKTPLTVVSCARFNHHKRLDKIAEALLKTNVEITWIHIGDERLGQEIPGMTEYIRLKQELSTRPNIQMQSTGALQNADIFRFYTHNPVNLFISLSENEGIPVSIMEAISFGIPVLATNAGGCGEIVTEQTGKLLPVNISTEEVARLIDAFGTSDLNTPEFRSGVRHFWENHFSEQHNYEVLMNYLN